MLATDISVIAPVAAALPSTVVLRTADLTEFAVPVSQIMNAAAIVLALQGQESPLKVMVTKSSVPTIEVPHVSSLVLSKEVLTYLAANVDAAVYNEATFKCNDDEFAMFDSLVNEELLQIAFAANVLEIPALLHTVGEVIAKKINGHDGEEVKAMFNLEAMEVNEDDKMDAIEEGGDWEELEEDVEEEKTM